MITAKIESLLKERMGLDARSIGAAAIERAVRERLTACGLSPNEYWDYLGKAEVEVQELIEAVVVPETWFFRDREAFAALTRIVLGEWLQAHPNGLLRVLSLPCATGEEPFSIAMALLDAGFPAHRFQVDAVDISLRAITQAEKSEYGTNSFRGSDLGFRERHFERAGRHYRLSADVRGQVRLRQANLFASGAFPAAHVYDVIFCRNVLIYFDRHGQRLAVRLLARLLTPSGILFVGPSESALLLDEGFMSARVPLAFAFRNAAAGGARKEPAPRPQSAGPANATAIAGRPAAVAAKSVRRNLTAVAPAYLTATPTVTPVTESWIEAAQRLADQGKLTEAMEVCERNFHADTSSAGAFYLMGLLHDAAGRLGQASEHYRKALYLNPLHQEALVHLGAALMRDGDTEGAQRLFDRAKRPSGAGGQ